jgi:hypothetical protein
MIPDSTPHPEHRRRTALAIVAVTMALVVVSASCSKNGGAQPATRPSSTARLSLISPTQGEVFTTSTIPVKVSLQDAKIVATTSTNLTPNEGHLHLYLDNQIVSMNYQADTVLHDVKPGQHLLKVEFVATDHAPFEPRVIVQVTFEVKS